MPPLFFTSFGVGPDGSVYGYSQGSQVLQLDPATGQILNASAVIALRQPRLAIDAAGRVFLTTAAGGGALYSFNPNLTLRWSDAVPNVNLGGPAIAGNGFVILSGAGGLRAYGTP
jgi:outer membrane protein assembly factor BamB